MNKSKEMKIHLDQIDVNDRSYIFTFELPLSQLINSIKNIGILHSPILEQKNNGTFRIVSGLKRILALRHLKIDQISSQVYYSTSQEPTLELFLLNFYENIGTRHLNEIEKSMVLYKLIELFHVSEDRVISEFLPLLELGSNEVVLSRYLKLVKLEDNIKIAIVEDFISIDNAVALLERSQIERRTIFNLFHQLKSGKNRQKELLRLLQELSEINAQSIDQILQNNEIQDVLANNKITLPQKAERIKEVLMKMRYPLFTKIEKDFQNLKKDLKLPPNIILRPPPFFEGDKYTIEFSFKNQSEFKKFTGILSSIADQNCLAKLESLA